MGIRKAKIPGSRQSISFCFHGALLWGTAGALEPSQSHVHLSLALLSVFRETLSVPTFHYIYNNLLRYYEMIMVEKKEAIVWGRRSVDGLVMPFRAVDRPCMVVMGHSPKLCAKSATFAAKMADIFFTSLQRLLSKTSGLLVIKTD